MPNWSERYRQAQQHVIDGRQRIERQRALVEKQKGRGSDTTESEGLLATFHRSQSIFEDDLARIEHEREQ